MIFLEDSQIVAQALNKFLEDSVQARKRVIYQRNLEEITDVLRLKKYVTEGGLSNDNLQKFLDDYLAYNTKLHHPHYLGHQCAAPHYAASLGTFINAFTNNVPSIYEMGPSSAAIEFFLINWMLGNVGWHTMPIHKKDYDLNKIYGGGVLVNGGSIANLTSLILARSKAFPKVWETGNPSNMALILPSNSHYSLIKAAGIIGIGKQSVYKVDVDDRGAIVVDSLPKWYNKVVEDGKKPIALVANACSTGVGIYDALDEIADFCQSVGLWLHVDGAHGASALISDTYKGLLKGVSKAQSLVWDAHKLLQVPSLCAALLVKDHRDLDTGLSVGDNASYLFHDKEQPGFDFIHRTLETTKPGLGEKLFFALGALGEKEMAKFIERQYALARQAYEYIDALEDFECPVRPESNILCFGFKKNGADHLEIRKKLLQSGNFYLTTVLFNDMRYLRLVFMNQQTSLKHIKKLVAAIRELHT